jgi:L-ascorbate metabolism protein UlaG (beta-lactamase superfamily)
VNAPFDGRLYGNLDPAKTIRKGFGDVLKWRMQGGARPWPKRLENSDAPSLPASLSPGELSVTGINHATDLIQFHGLNVLTDPVFSERMSPVSWLGPRRARDPGLAFDALPNIDAVLVSHNHYDHMDLKTLARLQKRGRPRFIVPLGNARHLRAAGIPDAVELDWWKETDLGGGASVVLTPAQHWSGRGLFDRRRALWGGFFVRAGGATAYFAGDTGYGEHFKLIKSRLGSPDAALLPIGAYEPRWFMKDQHVNPDEAVLAHLELGARMSLGMHFGTFRLSDEGPEEPVAALAESRRARGVSEASFPALRNGMTVLLKK